MELVMRVQGGGLSGSGVLLPRSDVRGLRIGIAARQLLLQLPSADAMPLPHDGYSAWHQTPRPLPNALLKVIGRLLDSGLIWSVRRWVSYGSKDWTQCLALTPLGADVVAVFGDDMRRGQRIRWSKWDRPSVAFTDELCRETLQAMNLSIADEADSKRMQPPGPGASNTSYGTSQAYLLLRIAREDRLWGDVLSWPQVIGGGHVSDYLSPPNCP